MKLSTPNRWSLSLVFVVVLLTILAPGRTIAQSFRDGFRTRFSSAIVITPVNTAFDILPNGMIDLVFSASAEFSFRKTDQLGYAFSGGYYPYFHRAEGLASFSVRTFLSSQSEAPTGGFLDWSVVGGVSQNRNTDGELTGDPMPVFGVGLGIASLRGSRFSAFAFEYGAGTHVLLVGGQPQFRANLFFGVGLLLGKEVIVN